MSVLKNESHNITLSSRTTTANKCCSEILLYALEQANRFELVWLDSIPSVRGWGLSIRLVQGMTTANEMSHFMYTARTDRKNQFSSYRVVGTVWLQERSWVYFWWVSSFKVSSFSTLTLALSAPKHFPHLSRMCSFVDALIASEKCR